IDRDGRGEATLIAKEAEDMWHAYNLISVGDRLRAGAIRRVQTEGATGSVDSQRVRTTLTIEVVKIDFDMEASVLRISGRNVVENPHVKMGAFHTLDLELNRPFTIGKDHWDAIALDRVDEATNVARSADVAAVVMEEGLAHVCLVTSSMTIV